ncbi:hypothetical protein GGTG_11889 [Gaeumannomyces tritici R3-111a-1]|uniref:Major facilitator superfamily (MFS) profile domain-containing protein n=1 Tax=Gaeumannomyces tritici (strain R3-111a-1) TaxID=644352 RepID=J3PEF8_GAET3|nr:hypothetical protein GGTG_11889 [Gaeumannomyces tritici R3-111a-1]EJT70866.1 hypothetical protein GGTG_11889 [Gaeumannomyces tritici R3-111a-1]
MGWGILEPRSGGLPLGTVRLGEDDKDNDFSEGQQGLKKSGNIVLQPQPSDDPNDPLNWSKSMKYLHFFVIAFGAAATNGLATMVTPGIVPMVEKFKTTEADISSWILTAPTFWTSLAGFFVVAGADVWGRRPFYLGGIALLAVFNYMGYLAQDFISFTAARTLAGFAGAPLFQLMTATLADIFYVHERGTLIALSTLALNAGGQIAQIISGFVIDAMGVSASFGFVAIVFSVLFPAAYFALLESAYFTPRISSGFKSAKAAAAGFDLEEDAYPASKEGLELPAKRTYGQNLAVARGRISDMGFWRGVSKPLGMITSPIIAYSALLSTQLLFLLAGVPTLISIVLGAEPYSLSPSAIGLTNLPLFAVALVGGPAMGYVSDALTRYMARTNGGLAEPEFRLISLAFTVPVTAVGLIGLAQAVTEAQPLPWLLVWNSITNLGTVGTTQISITYVVDCYPKQSAQAFITVNGIAALVSFVGTGPVVEALGTLGAKPVLGALAGATIGMAVLAIPMYIWGKRMRSWYSRAAWAQKFLTI